MINQCALLIMADEAPRRMCCTAVHRQIRKCICPSEEPAKHFHWLLASRLFCETPRGFVIFGDGQKPTKLHSGTLCYDSMFHAMSFSHILYLVMELN
jgi:hypothetical protein